MAGRLGRRQTQKRFPCDWFVLNRRSDLGNSEIRQGVLVRPKNIDLAPLGDAIRTQEVLNSKT